MTRILLLSMALIWAAAPAATAAGDDPRFEKDVLPIFTKYCFNCHGKSSPQLGLDLRSARLTMRGSQNGSVITPGSPEKSLLWKKISTRAMPLAQFKLKLSDAEIEMVRKWIATGAKSEPLKLPKDVQAQFAKFENEIRPLLEERCVSCHGEDDPEAELDLRSIESLVRGSKSGPVIVEGFSDKSVLIRKLADQLMPPPDAGEALSASEIQRITDWVDQGRFVDFVDVEPRSTTKAESNDSNEVSDKDRQFWAFQKPVAATPPEVQATDRIRTPIDRFVLAKLEAQGQSFSSEAPKLILLRRAYFDLLGIPPTPQQSREFLADEMPDAYERLIDRLLASPHYGERWGRYWLDAVGYVDTSGKDHNPTSPTLSEGYWRFRDYVVSATNKDKPWDRFLTEQIAGDELVDWRNAEQYSEQTRELLVATGFLRNVLDATNEDISNLPFDRYEALFKLMERVSSSTMGVTLACARCHSHKFDPIPQTDYYRFLSVFTPAYNPSAWLQPKKRHLLSVSKREKSEIDGNNAKLNSVKKKLKVIRDRYRSRLADEKLAALPEAIRVELKTALAADAKKRSKKQIALTSKHQKQVAVSESEIDAALSEADRAATAKLRAQVDSLAHQLAQQPINKVQALWDVGAAPTIRLLQRGDVDFAGPIVKPGFLTVMSSPGHSAAVGSANAVGETTGLRLAFAEWLTRREHPLTARVIVNRLWQHHFGVGIVDTPGNFGATGSRPTHPALLDWLAVEFIRRGWSAKQIHKMIMVSSVYRQSSQQTQFNTKGDPQNRLLGRMNMRRLDAEALRDSVIAASGQADYQIGGPPVMLKATPAGLQSITNHQRRSIYLLARRSNPATFMQVFDYPVIDVNCTRRSFSATPLQSLTMTNSEFLTSSAEHLARRVEQLASTDALMKEKIAIAYQLAYSRSPTSKESELALQHIEQLQILYKRSGDKIAMASKLALQNFAHMLICSNEFLYID